MIQRFMFQVILRRAPDTCGCQSAEGCPSPSHSLWHLCYHCSGEPTLPGWAIHIGMTDMGTNWQPSILKVKLKVNRIFINLYKLKLTNPFADTSFQFCKEQDTWSRIPNKIKSIRIIGWECETESLDDVVGDWPLFLWPVRTLVQIHQVSQGSIG